MAQRWIDVPTPRGMQQMKLKRGFVSYRIKGAGLPWGRDAEPADCIVTVVPLFPQELSTQQERLVDQLVAGNSGNPATAVGQRMATGRQVVKDWAAGHG